MVAVVVPQQFTVSSFSKRSLGRGSKTTHGSPTRGRVVGGGLGVIPLIASIGNDAHIRATNGASECPWSDLTECEHFAASIFFWFLVSLLTEFVRSHMFLSKTLSAQNRMCLQEKRERGKAITGGIKIRDRSRHFFPDADLEHDEKLGHDICRLLLFPCCKVVFIFVIVQKKNSDIAFQT